jgi:tetratricopeptide (TPR) repeat protein
MKMLRQTHLGGPAYLIALFLLAFWDFFIATDAGAQELPRQSALAITKQRVGLTDITLTFGRPSVRGRKGKIWGKLIPYQEIWRAGANECTTIETSTDIIFGGKKLPAGKYSFFVIPRRKGTWTVILNTDTQLWGTEGYDSRKDTLRIEVKPEKTHFIETLVFFFDCITTDRASLILGWENKRIVIPIQVDTVKYALRNIEKAIEERPQDWQVYVRSADYFRAYDPEKALEWANQAIRLHAEHFWAYWIKAEILALNRDYAAAIENAQKALFWGLKESGERFPYRQKIESQIEVWETF